MQKINYFYPQVSKHDIYRLADALMLPARYTCVQRTTATGIEAGLMILLRRIAYPSRWCDLVPVFWRSKPESSLIFNTVMDLM